MLVLPIAPGSGVIRAGIKAGRGGKIAKNAAKTAEATEKIQLHHEIPKYLGGAKKQVLVPLPKSYHQKITNAFRAEVPYGSKKSADLKNLAKSNPKQWAKKIKPILKKVYKKYPIKKYKKGM